MGIDEEFLAIRRVCIEDEFADLNAAQKEAVFQVNGPVLVLAGAGTGKTTVVTRRIAYMVKYGNAYLSDTVNGTVTKELLQELQGYRSGTVLEPSEALIDAMQVDAVPPTQILAITFTNKAANEMKERLAHILGPETSSLLSVSTFHSFCAKQLRKYATLLGYTLRFTIYDDDDSASVMRDIMRAEKNDKRITKKDAQNVLRCISYWKDNMLTPSEAFTESQGDPCLLEAAYLYQKYQEKLMKANAMDFDDLIFNMVMLLKQSPQTVKSLQEKYPYIMVDEYQDTSVAQFALVFLFTRRQNPNLCVVGDDDQSIYSFRGADVENILNFPAIFKGTHVVRLEENYRSCGNILKAANSMIRGATHRMGKTLHPNRDDGEKVHYMVYRDNFEEAEQTVSQIEQKIRAGVKPKDIAVLFRGNRQSHVLQSCLMQKHIPFRILGGTPLFERKEIKDILAYMTLTINPNDDERLKRIINRPARKIGPATVAALEKTAAAHSISMMEVIHDLDAYPELKKQKATLKRFAAIMESIENLAAASDLPQFLELVLQYSGYQLEAANDEEEEMPELFEQLRLSVAGYTKELGADATIEGFLEQAALFAQNDEGATDNSVALLTIHKSKGLEYDNVFVIGLVDGVLPNAQAKETEEGLDEERRILYVAMTRAKKTLHLSSFEKSKMSFTAENEEGDGRFRPSPFLSDIDSATIEVRRPEDAPPPRYDRRNLWYRK